MLSLSRFVGWRSSPAWVADGRLVMKRRLVVAEILTSGDSVSGTARRHGLSPHQLFGWRRQLRKSQVGPSEADGLQFVPAVDVASSASDVRRQRKVLPCKADPSAGTIEVEIDGVTIRVGRGADAKTLMTVLRALKVGA